MALNDQAEALIEEFVRREAELAREAATSPEDFVGTVRALLGSAEGASSDDREKALIGFLVMNMAILFGWSQLVGASDYKRFSSSGLLAALSKRGA